MKFSDKPIPQPTHPSTPQPSAPPQPRPEPTHVPLRKDDPGRGMPKVPDTTPKK